MITAVCRAPIDVGISKSSSAAAEEDELPLDVWHPKLCLRKATMHKDQLIFIDAEFSPASHQWLSMGAVFEDQFFYAHTSDPGVLSLAQLEFLGNPISQDVLGQLSHGAFLPGATIGPAAMSRNFFAWLAKYESGIFMCATTFRLTYSCWKTQ